MANRERDGKKARESGESDGDRLRNRRKSHSVMRRTLSTRCSWLRSAQGRAGGGRGGGTRAVSSCTEERRGSPSSQSRGAEQVFNY